MAPRTRSGGVRAAVGSLLVVAFAIGLTPAPAAATEPHSTALTEPAASTTEAPVVGSGDPAGDDATDPTVRDAVAPATAAEILTALALAQQVESSLVDGGVGGGIYLLGNDESATVDRAVEDILDILRSPPPVPDLVDEDRLLATVEALYAAVQDEGQRARTLALALVDDLTVYVLALAGDVVAQLPTAEEVVFLARNVSAWAYETGDATAKSLLGQLGPWIAYLTDDEHERTAKAALTSLVIALGNVVNPLPAALAPTTEATYAAAGEFVAWADELVQQGATGPGPFYDSKDTDTDEPTTSPATDLEVIDSDLVVADEPVMVPGPVYPTWSDSSPLGGVGEGQDTIGTVVGGGCGMAPNEMCATPVQRGNGRVVHRPVVRVVLAGSWWRTQTTTIAALDSVFRGMSGSGYQNILRQYYDLDGYIGADVVYQGTHIVDGTPPASVSRSQIGAYAAKAAATRAGWKTSPSVVWVVALPPGSIGHIATTEDGRGSIDKCGYQTYIDSGDRRYHIAEVDFPREGCDPIKGNIAAGLTVVGVHEYVGVVTNPDMYGWADGLGRHLPDVCRLNRVQGPGGQWVSQLWSNGDNRCVASFTPRFSYSVAGVTKPAGDQGPNTPFTRGHSYPGAAIEVRNTGNMPWLSRGGKITYLATSDNLCSPFAHGGSESGWVSCRRISMPQFAVAARERVTIPFSIKPDGSLAENRTGLAESFRMVAGTTWMANTGSAAATLGGLATHRFAAEAIGGLPNSGYVAVGQPGQETKVKITLRNTGTATWYPREVVNIGTPPGTSSPYAASDWPKGPGGCRACRAHRIGSLVPPNGVYTFDLTLRIPATMSHGVAEAEFFPFADVVRVSDRSVSSWQMLTGQITVQIVVVPSPLGTRRVEGFGFADQGVAAGGTTSGFSCAAVSNVDAVSTSVTACRATVTSATGYTHDAQAAPVTLDGPAALTTAPIRYDESAGDTIVVCWTATTTFLDGTSDTRTGCT